MVSRENKVLGAFGAVALVVFFALITFADFPSWVDSAVLVFLGVVCPYLLNQYLDRRAA